VDVAQFREVQTDLEEAFMTVAREGETGRESRGQKSEGRGQRSGSRSQKDDDRYREDTR
jgi:hypothetical protein